MAIRRARESFSFWDIDGVPHDVPAGSLVDTDRAENWYHDRAHLFEDVEDFVGRMEEKQEGYKAEPTIERATAEPGERRHVTTTAANVTKPASQSLKPVARKETPKNG